MTGFDILLGNPPWEMLEVSEEMSPGELAERRGLQQFSSHSGRFPLGGRDRRNLATLFVEHSLSGLSERGRVGMVLPTGVFTDKPSEHLTKSLLEGKALVSCFDKENAGDFPGVHKQQRYSAVTLSGQALDPPPRFSFFLPSIEDIQQETGAWVLTTEEILAMCETRYAIPCFRDEIEAEVFSTAFRDSITLEGMRSRMGLEIKSGLFFNFDAKSAAAKVGLEDVPPESRGTGFLPVYEGEYFHSFDHRFATTEGDGTRPLTQEERQDCELDIATQTWVPNANWEARWAELGAEGPAWVLALRRQARTTDETTGISAILPPCGLEGSASCFWGGDLAGPVAAVLSACVNSYAFNFFLRRRQSGANVSKSIYSQLPLPRRLVSSAIEGTPIATPVIQRVVELVFSTASLAGFAQACGFEGALPLAWDVDRRSRTRHELEAMIFLAYGLASDQIEVVMDDFPIVRRKEEQRYGSYRTKEQILELYDHMAECRARGEEYQPNMPDPKSA